MCDNYIPQHINDSEAMPGLLTDCRRERDNLVFSAEHRDSCTEILKLGTTVEFS